MRIPSRLLALACALLPLPVLAIDTVFTYQGTLEVGGSIANGAYDLQFQLLDGGNAAVGAPIGVENVSVVDGVFSVPLDFGAAAFNGDDRRLRIGVRPGPSAAAFTPLDPPTALTAAPYAQVSTVAEIASSIANNTVNSARVIDGSLGAADINAAQVQLRVAGTCPAGSSIRAVDPAGAVTCQAAGGGGSLALPFASTNNEAGTLFALTNDGDGAALEGISNSSSSSIAAVRGVVTPTSPGGFASAVRGINNGTGGLGIGVWGSQGGAGWGVYGVTPAGIGVYGNSSAAGYGVFANSNSGTGLFATSTNGVAANVSISNNANANTALIVSTLGQGTALDVSTSGGGAGVRASTQTGFGVHGITTSLSSAGIIGDNNGGGEAVVGRTISDISGAVVGRNDGAGAGVRGFIGSNTSGNAAGVLGQVGNSGSTGYAGRFENSNQSNTQPVLLVKSNSTSAFAVFQNGSPAANRIRFDNTGRGYFNGGTLVGGADLAEVVSISGETPEPGDVVEIDPATPSHFRRASTPRSALVAGVVSTDPGVTLNRPGADEANDTDAPALALAGRVPVKVTDENGAVAPGDLLVASSTPGHAMRASPNPGAGTVVGKALETFDDTSAALDQGVIEMLVMLR